MSSLGLVHSAVAGDGKPDCLTSWLRIITSEGEGHDSLEAPKVYVFCDYDHQRKLEAFFPFK